MKKENFMKKELALMLLNTCCDEQVSRLESAFVEKLYKCLFKTEKWVWDYIL